MSATTPFPPEPPCIGLQIILIYLYSYLKFSVVLHCYQIKSELSLISNLCYLDTNDLIVLQGASTPAGRCLPGSQSMLTRDLYTLTQDRFSSCNGWPPDFLFKSPNTAHPSSHCKALPLQKVPSLSSLSHTERCCLFHSVLSHIHLCMVTFLTNTFSENISPQQVLDHISLFITNNYILNKWFF